MYNNTASPVVRLQKNSAYISEVASLKSKYSHNKPEWLPLCMHTRQFRAHIYTRVHKSQQVIKKTC